MVQPNESTAERRERDASASRFGLVRLAVAIAISVVVAFVIWVLSPRELQRPEDIVGYPSYWNFNFHDSFLAYRLLVWVVPLGSVGFFWLLSRRGPWAESHRSDRVPLEPADRPLPGPEQTVADRGSVRLLRLLPPAAVAAIAVSTGPGPEDTMTVTSVLLGLVYLPLVLAISAVGPSRSRGRAEALSLTNAFAAVVVAWFALGYFARSTTVYAEAGGTRTLDWLPWWVIAVALLVSLAWLAHRLRSGWSAERLERAGVFVVVGTVGVYLLSTSISGEFGLIQGFDDMQSVTGADLLGRGLFPWRDFLFIHGLFDDALRSTVGFALFERSMWGAYVAVGLVWVPLMTVGYYLLGVWAAPRRGLTLLCVALLSTLMLSYVGLSVRWVGVCVVFVLLGEAVRRNSPRWVAFLTAFLFAFAVLVPEAAFQVIAVAVVLLLVDLANRPANLPWRRSLRLTGSFVLSGLVLCAGWAAFLAVNGSLLAFLDYFRIFGPGHAAAGSHPLTAYSSAWVRLAFGLVSALTVWTFAWAAWRLHARRSMTSRNWVTLACAILAALYGEKALGRFDDGHVFQSFTAALPLVVMWLVTWLNDADDRLRAWTAGRRLPAWSAPVFVRPVSALAVVAALVLPNGVANVWNTPTGNQTVVDDLDRELPLLGYDDDEVELDQVLADLDEMITALAGEDGQVFDFSNSLGIFYYLLQREPPTPFFHVSMAVPAYAQDLLVTELEEAQPEVVVFDSWYFGLPGWDGPHNMVRHFLVSQYLLDGWTPVVRAHGMLMMLRDDLVAGMPALPDLSVDVLTDELDFSVSPCDWGNSADFLESAPEGRTVTLPVSDPHPNWRLDLAGWAFDATKGQPVDDIIVVVDGRVAAVAAPDVARPDVAEVLGIPAAEESGFALFLDSDEAAGVEVYARSGGRAHPVPPTVGPVPDSLRLPDGSRIPVSETQMTGNVDANEVSESGTAATVTIPPEVSLDSFDLATFVGSAPLLESDFRLSDGLADTPTTHHGVAFRSLPDSDESVAVRVGSCLQWQGYDARTMRLVQSGETPIERILLSDVAP